MDAAARRVIAEQMLAEHVLDGASLDERASRCASAHYWTSLVRGSSITTQPAPLAEIPPSAAEIVFAARHTAQHGYAALPIFLPDVALSSLNDSIDGVVAAGWPPVFAFVFDAMWSVGRADAVRSIVAHTLGAGGAQVPHVWVHVVPAVAGARGWAPHKDGGLASGSASRLSVWIALTDASVDNGCIYVLPRSHAAAGLLDGDWNAESVTVADAVGLLSGARALPARAGSALVWDFDLVHWSGPRTGGGVARRSLSFEFLGGGAEPALDERPLLACGADDPLPTFEARLRFIAQGILQYSKHEASVHRFRPLAERLLTLPV